MKAPPLPSGRTRGLSFIVPEDWSPEQVLAVFELLDDLRELICARYLPDIQRALCEERRQRELQFNERDPPF
ncbi:conserved hypothetical protein [Paraburkholderia piptadeniae]|uniref:Uncharacterized protein n=1 Tax=Paraburkholderia piptadeniae TaxID=1701573 RepID=A0A1N7SV78_9BURK|nr:hypothetical protein [Paraburkholderia piptadeniae]SIT51361.1 conserved hypothetical protein [Paraburkholderia piptadeniae]